MKAGKYILIAIIVMVAVGLFRNYTGTAASSNAKQIADEYASKWTSPSGDILSKISRSLSENNVTGCGEYYVKSKINEDNVFALACTSDGKNFKYYLVWPSIGEVKSIEDDGIARP